MAEVKQGSCLCGRVKVQVTGDPLYQGYCHCKTCQRWSGAPVTAYSFWEQEMVQITDGEEALGSYSHSGKNERSYCTTCGGAVMTVIAADGLVDVSPTLVGKLPFVPTEHVFYADRAIDLLDGLPKFRDLPASAGGSDVLMDE